MIAIDTNILVRYAVKDDPKQTLLATNFIRVVFLYYFLHSIWKFHNPADNKINNSLSFLM